MLLLLLCCSLMGCQKDYFEDTASVSYRIADSQAREILYSAFGNSSEVIAKLNFKPGTLGNDTCFALNFYQFEDPLLTHELKENNAFIQPYIAQSKWELSRISPWNANVEKHFFYFIPVDHGIKDAFIPAMREQINVKKSFQLTFALWSSSLEKCDRNSARPYKIPLPRAPENSCSAIIPFDWNKEGYLEGYNTLNLARLVKGTWPTEGSFSIDHWEPVPDDKCNYSQVLDSVLIRDGSKKFKLYKRLISFETDHFDYIYFYGTCP